MLRSLLLVCLFSGTLLAQPERYELGLRLKAFELAWEKQTDKEARKRALEILPKVTPQFFGFQFGEAGRTLDEARFRLESKDGPTQTVRWLTSLQALPEKVLYTPREKRVPVIVKQTYKLKEPLPGRTKISVGFPGQARIESTLSSLPATINVPLPETPGLFTNKPGSDAFLQIDFFLDGERVGRQILVSVLPDDSVNELSSRNERKEDRGKPIDPVLEATALDYAERIKSLAEGDFPETDIPAHRLMQLRQKCLATERPDQNSAGYHQLKEDLFDSDQCFLCVPIGKKKTVPCRVYLPPIPPGSKVEPRPVVLALHGAGGTENLFFEGYGAGHVVTECAKRGWFCIAPRSSLGFSGGPPAKELMEALVKLLPIDGERIFVVGHSMGAAQTLALCQEQSRLVLAAAALGGGGRVKDAKVFDNLPLFIGVGDKDFALAGAKALSRSLSGKTNVTYKEYPEVEHLVIVREALPDVFAMFDDVLAARKK